MVNDLNNVGGLNKFYKELILKIRTKSMGTFTTKEQFIVMAQAIFEAQELDAGPMAKEFYKKLIWTAGDEASNFGQIFPTLPDDLENEVREIYEEVRREETES
jgi:hypothetical protein